MRSAMWIYAVLVLLVSETWSMDPGTNQSTSLNSSTTKQPKVYVAINKTFTLGDDAELNCSNNTWTKMIYEIWTIQLEHKNCQIKFNIDGRSENTCEDDKTLRNTSDFQPYLLIPAFSAHDLGVYICESVYSGGNKNVRFTVFATGATNTSIDERVDVPQNAGDFPWLYIPIGVLTFVLLVGFFIFAQRKLVILRRCCQADKATLKTSPTEDVEEVEPYASYVQRVNSIYNSSADFFSPKNPAHASLT